MFVMSDILGVIRTLAVNELDDLSPDPNEQNDKIIEFTNVVLRKRVRQAYNVDTSDPLTISGDGYQTFLKSGNPITEMYEPLGLYDTQGRQAYRRTTWDSLRGWWREGDNQPIHTKGITGDYTLKYIRYPAKVTSISDPVEFPLAGQWDLIYDVVGLIKLIKNFYEESDYVKKQATGITTTKASERAQGSMFDPPSRDDREE